ncbi:MAG: NAD(+) synthase [Lachnospiraceae bacterium]|nr:NAD(+) synthase [Lachnospiraceae bacterium]
MLNVNKEIENITSWIKSWFEENGPKANAVIGLSGGKDSSIVAALLVRALGKDRVVGVMMPNGVQKDISDSKKIAEFLDIRTYTVNIAPIYDAALTALEDSTDDISMSNDTKINLAPRIRMSVLYAIAQSLPNGGRVTNTCNASEDYIGYSTKYGDAAGDFSPCSDYTVTEMLELGDALNLPEGLVHKAPSDGLCGQTDEEKIGFTYAALDRYILTGECEDEELKKKIERMHALNLHKLQVIPSYRR